MSSNNKNSNNNGKRAGGRNFNHNRRQDAAGGRAESSSKLIGTISDFPILTLHANTKTGGASSNFYDFKKLFIAYVFKKYDECGRTFDDGVDELYYPPPIELPERVARTRKQKTSEEGFLIFKILVEDTYIVLVREASSRSQSSAAVRFVYKKITTGEPFVVNNVKDLVPVLEDLDEAFLNDDPFADINDPYHIKRDLYKESEKSRQKLCLDMKRNYLALYYVLWSNMSLESKARVLETDGFDENERDVCKLWLAILKTHRGGDYDEIFSQLHVRENYANLRQNGDSLPRFKERYDDALKSLRSEGEAVPGDQKQAVDFISKLDNKHFARFKTELANNVNNGVGQYPHADSE